MSNNNNDEPKNGELNMENNNEASTDNINEESTDKTHDVSENQDQATEIKDDNIEIIKDDIKTNSDKQKSKSEKYSNRGNVGKFLTRFFTVLFSTIKYPVEMLSSFVRAVDFPVAIAFSIINILISSLLCLSISNNINNFVSNSFSMVTNMFKIKDVFPLSLVFISSILLFIIFYLILGFFIFFFTDIVFGYKTTYVQVLCIISCFSIGSLPLFIIALIVSSFSSLISIFLFVSGIILGLLSLSSGLKGVENIKDSHITYILFFSLSLCVIIFSFLSFLEITFLIA